MRQGLEVPAEKLRYVCNPQYFHFQSTLEKEPTRGFIGQERAVEAIRFGVNINNPDYHIFITGRTGNGKKRSVLGEFLEKIAAERAVSGGAVLQDVCYIYNFEEPHRPRVVFLDKGAGNDFKGQMEATFESVRQGISDIFRSEEYAAAKNKILNWADQSSYDSLNAVAEQAKKSGLILSQSTEGYYTVPVQKNNSGEKPLPMSEDDYNNLPEQERSLLDEKQRKIKELMQEASGKARGLEITARQMADKLDKTIVSEILNNIFKPLHEKYAGSPKIINYFSGLKDCVLRNMHLFNPLENNHVQLDNFTMLQRNDQIKASVLPFLVNLFVDNSKQEAAPVVFESNPSFKNLFCRIEKEMVEEAYITNHTHLGAGSLCRANGGYLVLDALDILQEPGVWQKLKKTLKQGILEFEEHFNSLWVASLNPEPMPVNLKVIIVGEPYFYDLLVARDPDFLSVFKVKAEFDSETPLNPKALDDYAGFISYCCQKENLLPFDTTAVAKIVEQGARLAEDQASLSTKLDEIKDLAIESSYWAAELRSSLVQSRHVKRALESKRLRVGLTEQKTLEFINRGMLLIDTKGEEIGQINCLLVFDSGDYSFSRPQRIIARTFVGNNGLVSIQREVETSGHIHNTGVLTLCGYFGEKYGKYKQISFSGSISFEQSYHNVEGDSASVAELIALISSLSGLPISQSIAVTGSVNQKGEIQPIGGVNEKIEGFFNTCRSLGLTGEQGVVIPHQNIQNLILREDVVEACREGKFHIYAIKTTDEGLEILMRRSAEEIHQEVRKRLREITTAFKDK